ncbi:MAG: helix-turn-helix domain-containing protein [Clostridiales bacterium]|nr:helix-turn-helix domain-containing protein [Clostridiales bacterium]
MRKVRGKMELRHYEIPGGEYILALHGGEWRRVYASRGGMLHFHNLMEFGICREGNGIMEFERERVPYEPGMISVIPTNYPHGTISDEGTKSYWEYVFVDPERILKEMYPDDIMFQQKMLSRVNHGPFLGKGRDVPELYGVLWTILNESRNKKDSLYKECIRGLVLALLVNAARVETDGASMPESLKVKSGFDQVRPALTYIKNNSASPIKIADIAAVCHVSESHFRRLFEENIGMTPVEYLNHMRILKACDLIKRTGASMEEVALKVGFTTTSTFNRNFKKVTGTSPYQWKKQPDNFESRLNDFDIMVENGWY